MKTDQAQNRFRWTAIVVLFCIVVPGVLSTVWAQEPVTTALGITAPLYIGNREPLLDPYGRPMPGAHAGPVCSLVELRVATNSLVIRPNTTGMSHPFNPLLTSKSTAGMGLNTSGTNLGLFCMVLPTRPKGDVQVFARAYNAPTAAEATFYADSEPVYLSEGTTSKIVLNFHETRPLDTNDDDDDGLANSWERLLGTDGVATNDFDGDGMSDLHEMLAGTDPTEGDSRLSLRLVQREVEPRVMTKGAAPTRPVRVTWQSVPGKTYQLEHVPMLAAIDPETDQPYAFKVVDDGLVTAGKGEFEIDVLVEVPEDAATGVFRVKLVQ